MTVVYLSRAVFGKMMGTRLLERREGRTASGDYYLGNSPSAGTLQPQRRKMRVDSTGGESPLKQVEA